MRADGPPVAEEVPSCFRRRAGKSENIDMSTGSPARFETSERSLAYSRVVAAPLIQMAFIV